MPVRLQIAAIGVDSALMDLGWRTDGSMEVPPAGFPAGWYTGAPTPGELGPAIIAGHVDMKGPGVFYDLHNLKPDDEVTITRKDGSMPVFRVTRVELFPKDKFPTKMVYDDLDHAGLTPANLIRKDNHHAVRADDAAFAAVRVNAGGALVWPAAPGTGIPPGMVQRMNEPA